jgi:hypothetical protein
VPGWDDVRALALALPEVGERTSRGHLEWRVRDRLFVWERPLRRADLAHLGDRAPDAPPLGAWVPDLGAKEALLTDDPDTYLTTPHFDGHPIVLVRLDRIGFGELAELVTEAWLARAPRRVARAWLDDAPPAR